MLSVLVNTGADALSFNDFYLSARSCMFNLRKALEIHDDDPVLASNLLRAVVFRELNDKEKGQFFWLVNHVFGELLSDWVSAYDLLAANRVNTSEGYFKSLSVAAYCSGKPLQAFSAELECAHLAGISLLEVKMLVGLLCLQSLQNTTDINISIAMLRKYMLSLDEVVSPLVGKNAAATLNNIVSSMIEDARLLVNDPAHRETIIAASAICARLWAQFGTWVNHERSLYLCALVLNKFDQCVGALDAAGEALDIIQSNGQEDVDKAFLLLEISRAQQGLGEVGMAKEALSRADQIAEGFDPSLSKWFLEVRSKLEGKDIFIF